MRLGGGERVLEVLSRMYPDAPIYTLLYDPEKVGEVFPLERIRSSFLQKFHSSLRKRHKYLLSYMPRAIEELDLGEFDLVISSSSAFAHGIVTAVDTKHLCYCHSPMRYAWDWAHEYLEEQNIGPLRRAGVAMLMKKIRMWDQTAADRPDEYIANSENVRKRIKKYYKKDADVLYPPVNLKRFKLTPDKEDFFLIVSALSPYKKVELAVQLFNKIGRRLVVIGGGSQLEYLRRIASDNVDILGYKDDEAVTPYMENCRALIFPGEEDFGIVPVEAMACGKPVLAYGYGGVTESVVPGVTGELFYEATIDSMEDGLAKLLLHEKTYNPEKIHKQARKFSERVFMNGFKKIVKGI